MTDLPEMKLCRDCGEAKPHTEFWASATAKDGLKPYCKPCHRQRNQVSRALSRDREGKPYAPRGPMREVPEGQKYCPGCRALLRVEEFGRNRSSYDGLTAYCRPCHNAQGKANREKVGGSGNYHLKRRYGIDAETVDRMLVDQGMRCLICQKYLAAETLHVDHCHRTGEVRGLLCFNCNGGLGQFNDNPERMHRAIRYVQGRGDEDESTESTPGIRPVVVEIYRFGMQTPTFELDPHYAHG